MATIVGQQVQVSAQQTDKANDGIQVGSSNVAVVKSNNEEPKKELEPKSGKQKKELKEEEGRKPENEKPASEQKNDSSKAGSEHSKPQAGVEEKPKSSNEEKSKAQAKVEVVKLPVSNKSSRFGCFIQMPEFASDVNKRLYEYENNRDNQCAAMTEAIRLHDGDPSNTCVFFQSACLRAIGVPVPNPIGYTSVLWNWLEDNGWEKYTDFDQIQKGDIIFAGEYHTMCFMGWKDKENGLAYVMGNEAYSQGEPYRNRNLNGQDGTEENGWANQYRATRFYKYKGSKYNKETVISKNGESIGKGTVTTYAGLWLNGNPDLNNTQKIEVMPYGSEFEVLEVRPDWLKVNYNGTVGWCYKQYTSYTVNKQEEKEEPKKEEPKKEYNHNYTVEPYAGTLKATQDVYVNEIPFPTFENVTPLGIAKGGESFKVTGIASNGWYEIVFNGKKGYISNRYITDYKETKTPLVEEDAKGKLKVVRTSELSINSKPCVLSEGSDTVISANEGEILEIIGKTSNDWYKVKYYGKIGYVSKNYTEPYIEEVKSETVKNGWIKENNIYHYYKDNKKQTGWIKLDNIWYYLDDNGDMKTGWLKYNDKWYYLNTDGSMWIGWLRNDNKWYYLNSDGSMKTGWLTYGDSTYYLESDGSMVTGEKNIDDNKCVFEANGKLLSKTEISKEPTKSSVERANIKANGGLWLHSSKDISYDSRILNMENGDSVTVLEKDGDWSKVNYNGTEGWCYNRYLTNYNTNSYTTGTIRANGGLWLQKKPSRYDGGYTIIPDGREIKILGHSGNWTKVEYNGIVGWCFSQYIIEH